MKHTLLFGIGLFTIAILPGCVGLYDTKLPDDPENSEQMEDFLDDIEELPPGETKIVQAFIGRMAEAKKTEGYGYMIGTTVREALEKQKRWEKDTRELEERRAKEKEEKRLAEEKKRHDFLSTCEVTVSKKDFVEADTKKTKKKKKKKRRRRKKKAPEVVAVDRLTMELRFANKSEKDLSNLIGVLEFRNSSGELIRKIKIPFEEVIKAGQSVSWSGELPFDGTAEKDVLFAKTPLEELQTTWIPISYVFADGSTLSMDLP